MTTKQEIDSVFSKNYDLLVTIATNQIQLRKRNYDPVHVVSHVYEITQRKKEQIERKKEILFFLKRLICTEIQWSNSELNRGKKTVELIENIHQNEEIEKEIGLNFQLITEMSIDILLKNKRHSKMLNLYLEGTTKQVDIMKKTGGSKATTCRRFKEMKKELQTIAERLINSEI